MRPLAVLDIDGVLADVRHRLHHIERRPKDWQAFFAAIPGDPPLVEGVELARQLAADHQLLYLTGRPRWTEAMTRAWLQRQGLPAGRLVMRRAGDRRPAAVAKPALLSEFASGRAVAVVVDDDPDVCAALAAAGWPVRLADWMTRTTALAQAQEAEGRT
jgi:hypothetical protein